MNKQLYNIKKIASMKKEALVAGLGSFLSNQNNDPDRTDLNVGKAIGTEGLALGGFFGGTKAHNSLLTHLTKKERGIVDNFNSKLNIYDVSKNRILNHFNTHRLNLKDLKAMKMEEKALIRSIKDAVNKDTDILEYQLQRNRFNMNRLRQTIKEDRDSLRSMFKSDRELWSRIQKNRQTTEKVLRNITRQAKLIKALPILGYLGGGYLTHKGLNAVTKKQPSILDKIKGSF